MDNQQTEAAQTPDSINPSKPLGIRASMGWAFVACTLAVLGPTGCASVTADRFLNPVTPCNDNLWDSMPDYCAEVQQNYRENVPAISHQIKHTGLVIFGLTAPFAVGAAGFRAARRKKTSGNTPKL